MDRQKRISSLSIPQSVAGGSAVDNNVSLKEMMDNMRQEFTDQINDLKTSMSEQAERINEQAEQIKHQAERIDELADEIKHQAEQIKDLEAANANLSASDKKTTAILQHHSTMLHALHRRVLLDDARALIASRYGFPINELRPGGQVVAGKPKTLQQLVRDVCSQLTKDNARWLHDDALKMIFDSSSDTLCLGGGCGSSCLQGGIGFSYQRPEFVCVANSNLEGGSLITAFWTSRYFQYD
ncbi:uncharacterized protein BJ212DRAFT_1346904 [Suillus subaureus]|uniref:Uncharacterized protein n=1 Tax=Suillus subaureus TaxID=48587 RepID=A0A9P7EEQ8_9AGAM|nr:uncharacterized protein BJ212DRAFT_1346904 [Suillus subaureus]KAG1818683.1 hypothetical protein BJ212DRAFT_1346904 [Suillus subaureus]